MRVIIAGVPEDMADDYAARLIEQGKAIPAPPISPAPMAAPEAETPKAEAPKGKQRRK